MTELNEAFLAHEYARNGYDMDLEEVHGLTMQLLDERPPVTEDRYICYTMDGSSGYSDIGRFVERTCFETFFNNTAEDMHAEYEQYEQASSFFLSIDTERQVPSGALRVIRNSASGLKTINDACESPLGLTDRSIREAHDIMSFDECWDVGTVAAMPGYGSGAVSIQLYRGMYLAAMRENVSHLVSIVDMNVLPRLTNYLGIPFVSLVDTKPFEYLGSKQSQAVYGYVPEFYNKMNRKRKYTIRGLLAKKALDRLVVGTEDHTHMGN